MSSAENRPSEATRKAEQSEAREPHVPDREPTRDEEEAADASLSGLSTEERQSVAAHEREMAERGARQKGEGRLE